MNWLSGAKRWVAGKSIVKIVGVICGWFIGLLVVAVSIVISIIWYGEWEREKLIRSYETPTHYINMLGAITGRHPVTILMNDDESTICVIGSYGWVSDIDSLTEEQKASAPKSILPSVSSQSLYLLFFDKAGLSRIYLMHGYDIDIGAESTKSACIDRTAYVEVTKSRRQNSERLQLIFIEREMK